MPAMKRNEYGAGTAKLHVGVRPETKELLEEYAYRSRQTISKGVDTLLYEGAMRFFEENGGLSSGEGA